MQTIAGDVGFTGGSPTPDQTEVQKIIITGTSPNKTMRRSVNYDTGHKASNESWEPINSKFNESNKKPVFSSDEEKETVVPDG